MGAPQPSNQESIEDRLIVSCCRLPSLRGSVPGTGLESPETESIDRGAQVMFRAEVLWLVLRGREGEMRPLGYVRRASPQ